MIRHPNTSGLQIDPVSRGYVSCALHQRDDREAGEDLVFRLEGGISISADPNFRFTFANTGRQQARRDGHRHRRRRVQRHAEAGRLVSGKGADLDRELLPDFIGIYFHSSMPNLHRSPVIAFDRRRHFHERQGSTLLAASLLSLSTASAVWADAAALKALDPDNDGTIDLPEAQAGASKVFSALDPGQGRHARCQGAEWTPR